MYMTDTTYVSPFDEATQNYQRLDLKPSRSTYQYKNKAGHTFSCQMYSGRCLGTNKQNKRCAKRVVRGIGYCKDHLKSEVGLYVAKSAVEFAGDGLFAARDFKKQDKIEYINGYNVPQLCQKGVIRSMYFTVLR